MRSKNSFVNILVSCFSYVFLMLNSFLTRAVFSRQLGLSIAGIEGMFLNVVSMLGIVEMGIGTGIVYKLYKPIAEKNYSQIAVLLKFYKKAYSIIASVVLGCGFVAAFIVPFLVTEDYSKPWLGAMFMMYVFDVLASYLFAHKRAMFIADQKNYVNTLAHTGGQLVSCILQVTSLTLFHYYFLYLIIKVTCTALENVFIALWYRKHYPHIDLKTTVEMDERERKGLFKNIKALLFHKIGGFSLNSTSSMIIINGAGSLASGLYSNYMMIVNGLFRISDQVFTGIIASFGNLMNTTSTEKSYKNFKSLYFMNYLIYSFFTVSFFTLATPFVRLWIGENGVFPLDTLALLTLYFYIMGMRQSVQMVRTSAGIYRPDQYLPLVEAAINVIMGIILVKPFGVNGVLMANLIEMFIIPFWTHPYIIYKNVFFQSVKTYYQRYVLYAGITFGSLLATQGLCSLLPAMGRFATLVVYAVICLLVPNVINLALFYRTDEFQYLFRTTTGLLSQFKEALKKRKQSA